MPAPRLLLLSFYYPPDLSACSFRSGALVQALRAADPSLLIDVVTTLPNRYESFTHEAPADESADGVTVHRIALPTHQSGMVDQAHAFVHYARAAARIAEREPYDLVYATSSRLMTAALGARLARRLRAPLYLDIRDIFVDTIRDVLSGPRAAPLLPFLSALERWTVRRAAHVNLVSRGFEPWFTARYPAQRFTYFTNGVDDAFLEPLPDGSPREDRAPIRVLYAGNIGEGQGLHHILPPLAKRLEGKAVFRVIGDGGRRAQLQSALAAAGVSNVELRAPMPRHELQHEYAEATVLFLHLNDYAAFEKVLPSKIFECAGTGRPMWAGVAGYSAAFLRAEVENAAVFAPCDVEGALSALGTLTLRNAPRRTFVERFARARIMREMAATILGAMQRAPAPERAAETAS
jgi:glycosyltransferase involved in cell wall biosynthesis